MTKKKPRKFFCELYKVNILYFIGWPPEVFYKYALKHFDLDLTLTNYGGYTLKIVNGVFVIWTCPADKDRSALVHESVHAAAWILKDAGVDACFENDEAHAYLTELIYKKALAK